MSTSVNIYMGVIAVNSADIPRVPNKCCGKIPTTPHCPMCGKKISEELDLGFLEPLNSLDSEVLYFEYPGVTQSIGLDFSEEEVIVDVQPPFDGELPEEFRRLSVATWNPRKMVAKLSY
jgi:hypothetical protein